MNTPHHQPVTLQDLIRSVQADLDGPSAAIDIAEEEIERATAAHPRVADRLYHSFVLLLPTTDLMATPFVYRSHARELLARVVAEQDTRPGTAAEVCIAACEISQQVPLTIVAAGLYTRMWQRAFDGLDMPLMRGGEHYEALEGPAIDRLEDETRARIGRHHTWRTLADVTCHGHHHGVAVQCRFARSPEAAA